jgi:transcriptional regulator with XRE-family HTH domain
MKNWPPKRIKKLRKDLNLNQKEFGSLLGISARYVIYLEQGEKAPGHTLKILFSWIEKELHNKKGEKRVIKGLLKLSGEEKGIVDKIKKLPQSRQERIINILTTLINDLSKKKMVH